MASGNNWMGQDQQSNNIVLDLLFHVLESARGSIMVFMIVSGIVLLVLGALGPVIPGVPVEGELAGLMGLWGITAILYGLIGQVVMRLIGYK